MITFEHIARAMAHGFAERPVTTEFGYAGSEIGTVADRDRMAQIPGPQQSRHLAIPSSDEQGRPTRGQNAVELARNDIGLQRRKQRHQMTVGGGKALRQSFPWLQWTQQDIVQLAAPDLVLDALAAEAAADQEKADVRRAPQPFGRVQQRGEFMRAPEIA